jgi:asparagine synthase (glutamine-hydrolysing)
MCGICGVYHYGDGAPADEHVVREMAANLIHRGPDDEGFHFDGALGLGVRRLSIIDLEGGAQPISNEAGTAWVVHNGEIYNFAELRRELESRGHSFRTRSDTETVAHAFEQWGLDGLARLNGMFGLAVWDSATRELVVARDVFGVKPLYYWDDGSTLVFASEIRALLCHPLVTRSIDATALYEFFGLGYVPSPRTAFAGIQKLVPGHALVRRPEGGEIRRFYRRIPAPRTGQPEGALVEELRDAIFRAVRRQMVADVPVGAMLSGGIDSATVAAIMTEVTDGPIETFTVGFGGGFVQNELIPARETARRLGARHHEVVISPRDYADFLARSIWHLEEPIATTSTLPFYKVCELARPHVKVVLTGQGADEPFAGYPRYLGERYGSLYRTLPRVVRSWLVAPLVERLPRNEQLKRAVRSLGTRDPLERMKRIYSIIDEPLKGRLFRDGFEPASDDLEAIALWQGDVAHLDALTQMLYIDARTYLPDNLLVYTDKMSMAVSLEARVPFLDLELMELAESIGADLKIKRLTQKRILKRAMERWLPPEMLRRKKIPFATPVDEWLRRDLEAEVRERLLAPGSACSTYLHSEAVRTMIDEHRSGRQDHNRALFSMLTFELWHEQFITPSRWPARETVSA